MSDASLVRLTLDLSPDDGSAGILVGFIGMPSATRPPVRHGPTGRRRALLESLARRFGAPAREPTDSVKQDGVASRISRAASPPHRPGLMTVTCEAITKPVGPIGWAGAERSERWEGQMDGAIHSGERAATGSAAALTCAETASV